MEKIKLNFTHDNSVAQIILDDGKGNVLDSIMMRELLQTLHSFESMNGIKLITFEGAGKHFSFGASVEEHTKEKSTSMLKQFHSIFYSVLNLSIPTLAKISGQCLGGGMELTLICNFLFADKSAKLGQPEINLGVFAPPASILLPIKLGSARAEELLLTGKSISAEECKNIGLINNLFEDRESLEAGTNEWIEKNILPKSATSLRYAVSASRTIFAHLVQKMLPAVENLYLNGLMETEDANEGINSFLEKRKPEWRNR